MDVELTPLPGIGYRRTFTTEAGLRIGVVTHHVGGRRELVYPDGDDPDATRSIVLERDEAVVLAGLLGLLDTLDVTVAGPGARAGAPLTTTPAAGG
ncbi:potassium transporter TrkA [Micromonospora sp. CPCC 205546]|uniref:potassium transporter TrkA n=1 Tax=Micromonospora sp. CPCC 205546 TaxID=3122397 RepID=UPI002FF03870